jgi:hypothetical protein
MQIHCPSCGAVVPAADVNLANGMAKCRGCNGVFAFESQLDAPALAPQPQKQPAARQARRERPLVPMPSSITVERTGGGSTVARGYRTDDTAPKGTLCIVRRWFAQKYVFQGFFTVFWCGFLVIWYAAAGKRDDLMFTLFPIGHVAVGLWLIYSTLAGFLNRTTIVVTEGSISIAHAPIPWSGNRVIPTASLRQLYCEDVITRGKNGPNHTFSLNAVIDGGRKLTLLSKLETPDQARFIEQEVERFLGIVDAPVGDEFDPARP